jgi:hypothetical protein
MPMKFIGLNLMDKNLEEIAGVELLLGVLKK